MSDQDNILTKLHDLLPYVVPVLAKFPRDHKFTLGDRVLLRLLDMQECCVMAYYGRELGTDEIARIEDPIGERIDWFAAIADAICERLRQ